MHMEHFHFYKNQAETGVGSLTHHSQVGRGLGTFMLKFTRPLLPLAKKGAAAVKNELFNAGAQVVHDMLFSQSPMHEIVANNVRKVGNNLTDRAAKAIASMKGSGGIKRKGSNKKCQSASHAKRKKNASGKKERKRKPGKTLKRKLIDLKKQVKKYKDIFA